MSDQFFETIYARVPEGQRQALRAFRESDRQRVIEIDDREWRYVTSGEGEQVLVFLPGGFSRADIWLPCILELEATYRIVAVDASLEVFSFRRFSDGVLAILEREGIDRFSVIGVSYGGGLVQYMLQRHAERIDHAVLSHCTAITPRIGRLMRRLRWVVRLLPGALVRGLMERRGRRARWRSSRSEYARAFLRELRMRVDKAVLLRFVEDAIETAEEFMFDPEALESWSGETLILSSKDDRLTLKRLGEVQERYPRAMTHVFEEGGHETVLVFPEEYCAILRDFLDKAYAR